MTFLALLTNGSLSPYDRRRDERAYNLRPESELVEFKLDLASPKLAIAPPDAGLPKRQS